MLFSYVGTLLSAPAWAFLSLHLGGHPSTQHSEMGVPQPSPSRGPCSAQVTHMFSPHLCGTCNYIYMHIYT